MKHPGHVGCYFIGDPNAPVHTFISYAPREKEGKQHTHTQLTTQRSKKQNKNHAQIQTKQQSQSTNAEHFTILCNRPPVCASEIWVSSNQKTKTKHSYPYSTNWLFNAGCKKCKTIGLLQKKPVGVCFWFDRSFLLFFLIFLIFFAPNQITNLSHAPFP